jgi:Flp pilus assembly protein TadB
MNLFGSTVLTVAAVAALVAAVVCQSGIVAAVGVVLLMTGRALLIVGRHRERRAAERMNPPSSAESWQPPGP